MVESKPPKKTPMCFSSNKNNSSITINSTESHVIHCKSVLQKKKKMFSSSIRLKKIKINLSPSVELELNQHVCSVVKISQEELNIGSIASFSSKNSPLLPNILTSPPNKFLELSFKLSQPN